MLNQPVYLCAVCTAVSVAAAVASLAAAVMEASERLYRACVMLCEAECRECSAASELAEALRFTCLHNANRAKVHFDEGMWSQGGLHVLARLCSECKTTSRSVTEGTAEKHTTVCVLLGLYTYTGDSGP